MRGLASEVWRRLATRGYFKNTEASVEQVQTCLETLKTGKEQADFLFLAVKALCERDQDIKDMLEGRRETLG